MTLKRKRDNAPRSRHHPSQSSVDVPLHVKEDIKRLQDNRCWLCNCKANKRLRPLEICHVYPQARGRRYTFTKHHQVGHTRLRNIHDKDNLVALCSICHFAYDGDEWMFIPEEVATWKEIIEAVPGTIEEYNSQRNFVFRRLLLVPDPSSQAFQDSHYKSAFIDNPTRTWSGEPGVIIFRPPPFPPADPTAELQERLDDFQALQRLWAAYKSPCIEADCPICQSEGDEKQEKEDQNDKDEDDDKSDADDEENKDVDEENKDVDELIGSSRQSRKKKPKKQSDHTSQQAPLWDVDVRKSAHARKRRKATRYVDRDWMSSAPYDTSIPYSHRYGYTWAGTTSNELMTMWQAYRQPVNGSSSTQHSQKIISKSSLKRKPCELSGSDSNFDEQVQGREKQS